MDQQAASLLATLKRPAAPSDTKLNALNELKSAIKQHRVPDNAQANIYDCIRLAITQQASASLAGAAFSTLGHLIKRLKIQDATGTAITQLSPRLYPAIIERLGDLREQIRASASSALCEMWPFLAQDVEKIIRDDAIGGSNPRAKEAGMLWVVRMHKDESMPFKSYVGPVVASVEDADGTVRDAAKHALIDLFQDAPDRAKLDLKKQLKAHAVRHAIEIQILTQIGSTEVSKSHHEPEPEMASSTRSIPSTAGQFAKSIDSEAAQSPPPEIAPMDPVYVQSERELSDIFREMAPHFEGKETEQNWVPRDKSVTKIRRLLTGNAPQDYHNAFMAGIKAVLDGAIKVAISLRTTMSTNGCQLIHELVRILGPAMDPHVEILLQTFMKMSSATKHIAAENGRTTVEAVLQHCSYHVRMVQHIWGAAQEKNAQLRSCTPQWLQTVLKRQASYKTHFETSGGLDLAEKCIRKGLDDANPKVKEYTRATYWTFAKTWPDKAESIINKLDAKSRTLLEKDSNNPNAAIFHSQSGPATVSRATTPHGRVALKEMMAEQRRAKSVVRGGPDRPNSALATTTPVRSRGDMSSTNRAPSRARGETRVASNTSTASSSTANAKGGSLMSGPLRRPRKPEIQRPMTADPYASRRLPRPQTPSLHGDSPPKSAGASRSSIPTSSANRERARTIASRETSPVVARKLPSGPSSSRPTSKDSDQSVDLTHGTPSSGQKGLKQPQSYHVARAAYDRAADDGFMSQATDVMQYVSHSHESSRTLAQRAHCPEAHPSPMKAMFDAARLKLDRPGSSSSSNAFGQPLVPDTLEDDTPRRGSPVRSIAQADVPIYEDPEQDTGTEEQIKETQQVLSELPVNENVRMQSPGQSSVSSVGPESPTTTTHGSLPPLPASAEDRTELLRNRRLLVSGVERIRGRTIDSHGLRRVQDLAKSTSDIWQGGEKYNELMAAVLAYLSTFEQDSKLLQLSPVKATGLKAQALGVVRALITVHSKFARSWFSRVLVTLLQCRKQVDDNHNHLLTDLEKTADEIVRLAPSDTTIDSVVQHLTEVSKSASAEETSSSTSMALTYLRMLVATARSRQVDLGQARKLALAHVASLFLEASDAEVRKSDVDFACEVYNLYIAYEDMNESSEAKTEFWEQFTGIEEGRKGLLTYYIARQASGMILLATLERLYVLPCLIRDHDCQYLVVEMLMVSATLFMHEQAAWCKPDLQTNYQMHARHQVCCDVIGKMIASGFEVLT